MRPLQLGLSLVVAGVVAGACSSDSSGPTPTPTKVAFTVQPSDIVAGAVITPAVKVAIQDATGALVSSSTAAVTIGIGTNPSAGTLSGTTTVNAVAGVATFSNLSIDNAGTGYTLAASASGLTTASSTAFNVTSPPVPTKVGFIVQPSNVAAGVSITPAIAVAIQDVNGATVTTSTAAVTIGIGTNPAAGTLSGTTTVNAVAGVATFSNLSIDNAGTGYTLAASVSGLTTANSTAFNVTSPPVPTQVAFLVQPTTVLAAGIIAPPVKVAIQDVNGATVTTSTAAVTIGIGTNPAAGTLSGTATVNAVAGVATFSNLSIDNAGTGYTLAASSSGLTTATSTAFDVTVAPPAPVVVNVGVGILFTSVHNATSNPAIDTVTLASGRAVQWKFLGGPHSVVPTGTPPGPFTGSGAFQSSGTYSFTFSVVGTYTYECGVHGAQMNGAVRVEP